MKKKFIGIAALAAIMTLSAGITAFAGWETGGDGLPMWRNADGKLVYAGWVTDPDTGYQYYMDPDGHPMKGTTVEGYWLDDDGIKRDKSEAQIAAEERRAAREAAYYTPAKEASARNDVANEAKTSGVALSTTRLNYQAEMYTISNSAFDDMKNGFSKIGNKDLIGGTTKNNITNMFWYRYETSSGIDVITSDMPKAVEGSDDYYNQYALELHYNRNIEHEEDVVTYINAAFEKMLIGALGEQQGAYVYNEIMALEVGDDSASLRLEGLTDTGNAYTVRYSTNNAYIDVSCSEIVPEVVEEVAEEAVEGEEGALAEGAEALAEEYVADEAAENVIVSGGAEEQMAEEIAEEITEEAVEEYNEEEFVEEYEEEVEEEEEED